MHLLSSQRATILQDGRRIERAAVSTSFDAGYVSTCAMGALAVDCMGECDQVAELQSSSDHTAYIKGICDTI